jgi:hypothetical protein
MSWSTARSLRLALVILAGVSATSNAFSTCLTPPSGLVAWWKGESNAVDQVSGSSGSLVGNTGYDQGMVGQGFVLDGSGDGVQVPASTNLHLQNLTIEAWIKRSSASVPSFGSGNHGVIFSHGTGGYFFFVNADGNLVLSKMGNPDFALGPAITDTSFHHVAVSKEGAAIVFYLDGVAYPAGNYNVTFTFTHAPAIGYFAENGDNSFYGKIDELSIYNRALTTNEISAIFVSSSAGKCDLPTPSCTEAPSGLVSWWAGESNALDRVGGNNGTLDSSVSFGLGTVGQALVFKGTNGSGVRLGSATNLQLQNFTIETWIKRSSADVSSLDFPDADLFAFGLYGYGFGLWGDGNLYLTKIGIDNVTVNTGITDTNWHHVAVTKTGSSVMFFVDGTAYPASPYNRTFEFNTPAAIGMRGDSFWNSFYGAIDEMSIYNRALGTNEIKAIYNAGVAGKCDLPVVPSCTEAPSGLVSWWAGESNVLDRVGRNNGTLMGAASYTNGMVGRGFGFQTNLSAIRVGAATNLQLQNFTVETWIKRSSTGFTSLSYPDADLFGFGLHGYAFGIWNNGKLYLTKVGVNNVTVNTSITDTNWHHVAVTKSGTTVVFYVDGLAYPAAGAYTSIFEFSSNAAAIGARGDSLLNSFHGAIDELSVYNRALTTNEIAAIYAARDLGKCYSNRSPVAGTDSFATPTNTPASLPIAKLLLNDSDPDGDNLAIISVSNPSSQGGTVSLGSGVVNYTPPAGFAGIDTFSYFVTDGHGGGATGFVAASVGNGGAVSLNIVFGPMVLAGNFVVNFAGIPGLTYTIEAASAINGPWTKVGNLTAPTVDTGNGVGVFQFVEPVGGNGSRFYRTVYPAY